MQDASLSLPSRPALFIPHRANHNTPISTPQGRHNLAQGVPAAPLPPKAFGEGGRDDAMFSNGPDAPPPILFE
jgi:hypothetical protein